MLQNYPHTAHGMVPATGNKAYAPGFSLIELIMAILILGILSAVVVAEIARSAVVSKLEAARFRLKSDIIYAQNLAVTQQLRHGVVFSPSSDTYSVYSVTAGNIVNNPLTRKPFTLGYSSDPEFKGIDLVSASFGSPTTDQVEFDSFGVPYSGDLPATQLIADGTVTLSYKGIVTTVTVTKNTGKLN